MEYISDPERVTYFAKTDARNKLVPFGIKANDRTRHVYVIGKTGMGKSTLLENMAVQDIKNGEGFCFVDPHGKTAELLLEYIPEERIEDVLYFAPFDLDHPISFNVMEDVGYDKRHLVVSGLMSAFKKIWLDAWSARMEYILTNTLLALLEYPDATMLGVNKMYTDKNYRKKVVENIKDPLVKSFWVDEFATYTDRYTQEATPAIQNKIGQFTGNPLIRNIVGQAKSTFDLRKIVDNRKILIVNLSKGKVGEQNANLLGSMLITKIYLAAMSRADVSPGALERLPNFYFYVDEFQSFANESFADILSEARKYKLNLTMAHQYIEQMSEEVRNAVFGNVGTMITFRVGAYDAEVLEKEFAPQFTAQDLVNLGFAQIYLKLMINGIGSKPFSAETLPPIKQPSISSKDAVIEYSRKMFSNPRDAIEAAVKEEYTSQRQVEMGEKVEKRQQDWQERQERRTSSASPSEDFRRPARPTEGPVVRRGDDFRGGARENSYRAPSEHSRYQPSEHIHSPRHERPPMRVLHEESNRPHAESAPHSSEHREKSDERAAPSPVRPPNVHTPFAQALSNVSEPHVVSNVPQKEHEKREIEPPAQAQKEERKVPQTQMHSNTTKDKGPSEKNLTGLKAALSAVLKNASHVTETKKEAIPERKEQGSERTSVSIREEKKENISAEHIAPTPKQQAPAPVREETRSEEKKDTPVDQSSIKKEMPKQGPEEIPEDVLKRVLRGEPPK